MMRADDGAELRESYYRLVLHALNGYGTIIRYTIYRAARGRRTVPQAIQIYE
jgi:hypothetical protein